MTTLTSATPTARHAVLALVALCLLVAPAVGSEGDLSHSFQRCLAHCKATGCTDVAARAAQCSTACPERNGLAVPLALRVTAWSCEDDCKYHCMTEIEASRPASSQPLKYYGKWPFQRLLGAQELASVLLSLGNMAVHIHCCLVLLARCGFTWAATDTHTQQRRAANSMVQRFMQAYSRYPYLVVWVLYAAIHSNAWLWSAVFHTRDTWVTERLDYVSANLVVSFSVVCIAIRAFWPKHKPAAATMCMVTALAVLGHLRYMLLVKFDYGWNMKFCLGLGVVNTVGWIAFCQALRHPHRWTLYSFLLLVHVALLLEVLDFPPILLLLDAHASWHAVTIPLVYLFYQFVLGDVEWLTARKHLREEKVLS